MINHVVLFKLKEYPAEQKKQILDEFKSKLLALKGKIPELKTVEVGENFELASKSFDLALISHFEDVDDLDIYRLHPEHQKVVKWAAEVTADRAAVDFVF